MLTSENEQILTHYVNACPLLLGGNENNVNKIVDLK
jgi:hypothetical protein